jgi:UDP-N-acetylglucosamine 2-epimerase
MRVIIVVGARPNVIKAAPLVAAFKTWPEWVTSLIYKSYATSYLVDLPGYLNFLKWTSSTWVVLTDSVGIQERTTILNVPCLTLRENRRMIRNQSMGPALTYSLCK